MGAKNSEINGWQVTEGQVCTQIYCCTSIIEWNRPQRSDVNGLDGTFHSTLLVTVQAGSFEQPQHCQLKYHCLTSTRWS